jgi:cytochrome c biogenesis protein CcmG/thiol:disulfide interchange protein DsbE
LSSRLLLCAWLVGCASAGPARAPAVSLPALAVQRADGQTSSFQAATGGFVTVVDLWATWCTGCERERPKLARLDAAYRAQGLRVIGLNVGEAPSVVGAYLAEHPLPYESYLDPDFRIADALGEHELPRILLVDRERRIVRRSASLDAALLAHLKSLLSAPAPR